MTDFLFIKKERLNSILKNMKNLHIGVLGDFCLDAYWFMGNARQELSLETGKTTHAVTRQVYSLGGAGNVVNNLASLGIGRVYAFGVIGNDIFGRETLDLLKKLNVETSGLIIQKDRWQTPVYAKPYLSDEEQERVDFGRFNRVLRDTANEMLFILKKTLPELNAVIVNQQLLNGTASDFVISALNKIAAKNPDKILMVDSRNKSDRFSGMFFKLNPSEAVRMCREKVEPRKIPSSGHLKILIRKIYRNFAHKPVFISMADHGILGYDGRKSFEVPGIQILSKTDTVGAGDTMVAAMTVSLSAGASLPEAAVIGNLASSITVRKIKQTGTVSPSEILEASQDPDYIYRPEKADDVRKISLMRGTEFELINPGMKPGRIRHVLFDHDGTISCLRQGWEYVMENMMVKSILGPQYDRVNEDVFRRIVARVRKYIDLSSGHQTIIQMQALAEMVREYGFVPRNKIKDGAQYKKVYTAMIRATVDQRLEKFRNRELGIDDVTIKGAVPFLRKLRKTGMKLYLASGTDRADVVREAGCLGYANLFMPHIYGAIGAVVRESKKDVVENIIRKNKLSGSELAGFGDGPVEIREIKKKNGIAIGIASDEVRRYGFDFHKRSRLVKAGADIIIPDYSQADSLLKFLRIS